MQTGNLDLDREILLRVKDDRTFLSSCSTNSYYRNKVCNDLFFKRRLQSKYPDVLKYRKDEETWKNFFLKMVSYIAKLKEEFSYDYVFGNPQIQYDLLRSFRYRPDSLIYESAQKGELALVKEGIRLRGNPRYSNDIAMRLAALHGQLPTLKYLVEEEGADVNALNGFALRVATRDKNKEIVDYLLEHGADPNYL